MCGSCYHTVILEFTNASVRFSLSFKQYHGIPANPKFTFNGSQVQFSGYFGGTKVETKTTLLSEWLRCRNSG